MTTQKHFIRYAHQEDDGLPLYHCYEIQDDGATVIVQTVTRTDAITWYQSKVIVTEKRRGA